MIYERIKEEFIKEIEELIQIKRKAFEGLTGVELATAKYHYLEDFDDYVNELNIRINKKLDDHKIDFESQEQADDFQVAFKPTFDMLYEAYTAGLTV